jgi:hypothetical protein
MNLDEIRKARSRAVSQLNGHPYKNLVDKFFHIMEIGTSQKEAQVSWEAVFFGRGEVYNPWYAGGEFIGEFINTGHRIGILSSNTSSGFNTYGLLKKEKLPSSDDHLVIYKDGSVMKMQAGSLLVIFSKQADITRKNRVENNDGKSYLLNGKMREFIANIH